jgi:hypothetical protein
MSSKEIALETGLSPQTVDTYIKTAMGRLGTSSRREAARKLAAEELSQKSGSPPNPLESGSGNENSGVAAGSGSVPGKLVLLPFGGRINDLPSAQRTYAVLKVAAVSAVMVIALALLIAGVMQTFR